LKGKSLGGNFGSWVCRWTKQQVTLGFVQLGHDVETIIGSVYPSFGFGRRNSAWLLLVNFGF
jgi:hypothetical protein